ncbi:MAG: rod shape-determining protein MreD [Halomonadaceae bacterium]|nr:MAG: rod shape-determining protein MreD [Halomonadaceae bacterium]
MLRAVNYPLFLLTVLVALVASISLFPESWVMWRPQWLAMLVIYWVLRAPHRFGILTAWSLGLLLDVLNASMLGVHAMSLSLIAALVMTAHQRLQMYPLPQQCLVIFLFIGLGQMLVHFLHQLLGLPRGGFDYLFPAFTSALVWPVFLVLMDGTNRKLS